MIDDPATQLQAHTSLETRLPVQAHTMLEKTSSVDSNPGMSLSGVEFEGR